MGRKKKNGFPGRSHVGIDLGLFYQGEFLELSMAAKVMYSFIKSRYKPNNNGEIKLSYRWMQKLPGFSWSLTINKALDELEAKGWIVIMQKGGLMHHSNCYKLTYKYDHYGDPAAKEDKHDKPRKRAIKKSP